MKKIREFFPPPLHVSLSLGLLLCSLVYVTLNTLVLLQLGYRKELDDQALLGGKQVARLSRMATKDALEEKDILGAHMDVLASYSRVKWAGICDENGRLLASTKPGWIGRTLQEVQTKEAGQLITEALATKKPLKKRVSENGLLMTHPIFPADGGPAEMVAVLERDMEEVLAGQRKSTLLEGLASAMVLLVLCLIFWWCLRRFLRGRMEEFLNAMRKSHDSPGGTIAIPGADEFSQLALAMDEQETLFRQIVNNINEVVWVLDDKSQLIYVSPAYERVWGRDREGAMSGKYAWNDYIPQDHLDKIKILFGELYRGQPIHFEYPMIKPTGERGWIESSAFPVRNASGTVHRVVSISRDVTNRKFLEEQFLNVSEQERRRLGHDLHDDACQRLASLKMRCDVLVVALRKEGSPSTSMAEEIKTQVGGTSALLRDVARGLSPVEMDGEGLMLALEKLARLAETIYEVPCFFTSRDTVLVTDTDVANHIYRIAQEFINNAARHGHPTRIDIVLSTDWEFVRLLVTNDGKPFREPEGASGMGLKIIRYRANAIGAIFSIRAGADDVGTVAECLVPQSVCNPPEGMPTPTGKTGTATPRPEA